MWGYLYNVTSGSVTYPIPYQKFSIAVGSFVDYHFPVAMSDDTITGFNYRSQTATNFRWISIGK